MFVFQYKCRGCASVFEHLVVNGGCDEVSCLACGSKKVDRMFFSDFKIRFGEGDCKGCRGCPDANIGKRERVSFDNFSKSFVY